MLSPFDNDEISNFLGRWCELYARDQSGDTLTARQRGKEEGRALASDVLAHPQIRELARSPLLLTVLAIIQRAGVRLPDHRVELYEHATRILVERWNRVRSLSQAAGTPPIKTADAVRLLGPVALETIRTGTRGAISEENLRELLRRSIDSGQFRGLTTPEEALKLFRHSLGLLVEQGPGLYSFLHLTLAEYFAARELVRTQGLEQLAADPKRAFLPEWREVILLATGELGVNRADDVRLESLVRMLLQCASQRTLKATPSVPSLLAGLLADDAGLQSKTASQLLDALIPDWWFAKNYGTPKLLSEAILTAGRLVHRILSSRFADELHRRLEHHYGNGASNQVLENLSRGGAWPVVEFLGFLDAAGIDYGPFFFQCYQAPWGTIREAFLLPYRIRSDMDFIVINISVSRWLDSHVREQALPLGFLILFSPAAAPVFHAFIPWTMAQQTGAPAQSRVELEVRIRLPEQVRNANLLDTLITFHTPKGRA
jgi:hypothetical protein